MALDQSALLEVLDALRNADAGDRIKAAAETIYQAPAATNERLGPTNRNRPRYIESPITVLRDEVQLHGVVASAYLVCLPVAVTEIFPPRVHELLFDGIC